MINSFEGYLYFSQDIFLTYLKCFDLQTLKDLTDCTEDQNILITVTISENMVHLIIPGFQTMLIQHAIQT